ncbi:hypothetical protein B7P33_17020 [Sediminicola luteus]|uniref:Uncharacterized protein n=1 Tax=Sediminicola luteus TaxID=319238 RepID=A0A2A4G2R6_9FLAO|nr:hypothetical protein B7P33_17020 [Sediminicola luteus]
MITQWALAQKNSQTIEMAIDGLGNADLNMSMKMNAQQWQVWNNNFGNNPAALKREVERGMPGYFLSDFNLEKDDMARSFNFKLKAYGVCKIDKRGKWSLDTDEKDAHLTELSPTKYMLVSNPEEFGGQLQQTFVINFPDKASDIKVDTDSFGNTLFSFTMDPPTSGFHYLRYGGIVLLLIGGGWASKQRFFGTEQKK